MASRRKKKRKPSESMERIKPPLMFVESPVQGLKHYCTPVQAARNPFMAPSIAVDSLTAKWVSPQFSVNDDSPLYEEIRRRRRRNKNSEDHDKKREQQSTKMTVPLLDFENKARSAVEKTSTRTTLRRSTRLKAKKLEKCDHFLFGNGNSVTPVVRKMKVLAPETPDCVLMMPVVLRKLRLADDQNEKFKVQEKQLKSNVR